MEYTSFLTRLDHIQLAIPAGGEDVARAFYGGVLGLREVPKPPELAARGGAWFTSGPIVLHLGVDRDFRAAQKAHPAFRCDNYVAFVDHLIARGVDVTPDALPFEGAAHCYIADPFGNRLEIIASA
jgi:catechol 2,3-dioxygenase-like lactoylglutathione lyase family enzyme